MAIKTRYPTSAARTDCKEFDGSEGAGRAVDGHVGDQEAVTELPVALLGVHVQVLAEEGLKYRLGNRREGEENDAERELADGPVQALGRCGPLPEPRGEPWCWGLQ